MKSVSDKTTTLRRAKAVSVIVAKPEAIERLKTNDLPKKDVLAVARVAGVQAAKKTFDLIPYCHPIPIDWVEINFEVQPELLFAATIISACPSLSTSAITGFSSSVPFVLTVS
jgi:molybdenum cofactor biosynthesis protein MoaC